MGPGNFWSVIQMLTETEDEEEGSGISFPFGGGFGKKLLDFVVILCVVL